MHHLTKGKTPGLDFLRWCILYPSYIGLTSVLLAYMRLTCVYEVFSRMPRLRLSKAAWNSESDSNNDGYSDGDMTVTVTVTVTVTPVLSCNRGHPLIEMTVICGDGQGPLFFSRLLCFFFGRLSRCPR